MAQFIDKTLFRWLKWVILDQTILLHFEQKFSTIGKKGGPNLPNIDIMEVVLISMFLNLSKDDSAIEQI